MVAQKDSFFLKYEHGSHKVVVEKTRPYGRNRVQREFSVEFPRGKKHFRSFRELLKNVLGEDHPVSGVTFERYFKTEKAVIPEEYPEWEDLLVPQKKLGIDLSKKHKDIERLMYSGFGDIIKYNGYDPNDVLQEIYRGILARNKGTCPFDETKGSFGKYVYVIINCILNNYHRKRNKWKNNEVRGKGFTSKGEYDEVDSQDLAQVSENFDTNLSFDRAKERLMEASLERFSDTTYYSLVIPVLDMLVIGHTQTKISKDLGLNRSKVSKVVRGIRECARGLYC